MIQDNQRPTEAEIVLAETFLDAEFGKHEKPQSQEVLLVNPRDLIIAQPEVALAEWVSSLVEKYSSLQVTDEASEVKATSAHAEIHGYLKQIEAEKLTVTKPARDWVSDINGSVLNLTTPLKKLRDNLLSELQTYRGFVRVAQAKEQARLQKLADNRAAKAEAAGKPAPLPEAVAPLVSGPPMSLETDMGNTSFVKHWHFVITNPDLIPKEFWDINEVRLNAVAVALKEKTNIPGGYAAYKETPSTRR